MNDVDQPTQEFATLGGTNGDVDEETRGPLLDRLAQLHTEVKQDKFLDLDIPGYDGLLFARFRPYEVSKTERKAKQLQRQSQRNHPIVLRASCDTITDACEQLWVRDDSGEEMPIDPEVPVKFDKRLAQLLKFDTEAITEARHVVMALFPTEQSILKMNADIMEWLTTAVAPESDEEFLGESRGTQS